MGDVTLSAPTPPTPGAFAIGDTDFLLNGEPFRILAGAIHYFRVHPDHWADRIRKAKLMGLNTIETYVAWNAHSPVRGTFDTVGQLDLARFLDLIAAEGMYAIVRPARSSAPSGTTGDCPAGSSPTPPWACAATNRSTWRPWPSTSTGCFRSWRPGRSTAAGP